MVGIDEHGVDLHGYHLYAAQTKVPLIVRLEGTRVKEGKEILAKSGLKLEQADSLWEAAQKAVAAAKR